MEPRQALNRNRSIIRTSLVAIAANFLLAGFKLMVGLAANSVSILTDAINNVSDALSSAVTIVGTRLSAKEPDRKHPFGYGRIEYLSSLLIGVIILYAGFDALRNSIARILHPEPNDYSTVTLLVVGAAVLVKVFIGLYTKKKGVLLDSEALRASGKDALNDAAASTATLIAAVVYMTTGRSIEAWVGALISLIIIKAGFETLRETTGDILGRSADVKLAAAVRKSILSFPEIDGVYDIIIHNYGKEMLLGSAHIEVSDKYTVAWVDNLQRAVMRKVREDTGVEMLGLSLYAINTRSEEAIAARETVRHIVLATEGAKQMHGFYIDLVDKSMSFDAVLDFGVRSRESFYNEILQKVLECYPEYTVQITVDYDFTDSDL